MANKKLIARRAVMGMMAGAVVALPVAQPAAAKQRPAGATRAVQRQLDLLTGVDGIPGALAQIRAGGGRSITLTSGTAELGTGRPMVGGHGRYRVGSATKPFTAVAVLQLVDEGMVRLDEPIETYLPGVVRGTGDGADIDGQDISVRQLLQHTSGIPDYLDYLNLPDWDRPVDAAELVRLALSHKPDFDPGKGWNYTNTGYLIAGMLVERLTDTDIGTAVTERVVVPAGLHDTYWPPAGERQIRGPHARAYTVNPADPQGPLVDITEFEPSVAGAAGALISTPSDLNQFWRRLFDGQLLPRQQLAEMKTVMLDGPGKGYGLGLQQIQLSCGGSFWGHGGDHLGTSTRTGRDATGRQATVYITAQTGSAQAKARLKHTVDTAFCAHHGPGHPEGAG